MAQTVTTTSTKGSVIALILIVLALGSFLANIKVNGPIQWFGYAVFVVGIIWSINLYGKQINYNSTFGNYFAHGFRVAAMVTAIMIIYIIIFVVLFPSFKEDAIDQARKSMQEKNNLTPDQITQGLEMTRKFFMVFLVGGTLIGYLIIGSIAALVGAAITKKEPNQIIEDVNQIG